MDNPLFALHIDYEQASSQAQLLEALSTLPYEERLEPWFDCTNSLNLWIDDSQKKAASIRVGAAHLDEFNNLQERTPLGFFDASKETLPIPMRVHRFPTKHILSKILGQRLYSILPRTDDELVQLFVWMSGNKNIANLKTNWLQQSFTLESLYEIYWTNMRISPLPEEYFDEELRRVQTTGIMGEDDYPSISEPLIRWPMVNELNPSYFQSVGYRSAVRVQPVTNLLTLQQFGFFHPASCDDLGYVLANIEAGIIKANYKSFLQGQRIRYNRGDDIRYPDQIAVSDTKAKRYSVEKIVNASHWGYFIKSIDSTDELKKATGLHLSENGGRKKAYEFFETKMGVTFTTFERSIDDGFNNMPKILDNQAGLLIMLMLSDNFPIGFGRIIDDYVNLKKNTLSKK